MTITDKEHPIRGMKDFQHVNEEVRRGHLPVSPNDKVLAAIFCNQTLKELPAVVITEHGKGRTFYCSLGYPKPQ